MKHGAGIEQFGIKLQAAMLTRQSPEIVDAAGVMEEQRRNRVPHHLGDLSRQPAVGDCHASDDQ
jgi:hypothetical protein